MKYFNGCKEFVFVDSMPRNDSGYSCHKKTKLRDFLNSLMEKLDKQGFRLLSDTKVLNVYSETTNKNLNSRCLLFTNDDIQLKYYISTAIPLDIYGNSSLRKDLSNCDTLLISKHFPNTEILSHMQQKFHLIGYPHKKWESIEDHSILTHIQKNPTMILSYTVFNHNKKEPIQCSNFQDFIDKNASLWMYHGKYLPLQKNNK
jgi:hypothetical protein